MSYQLISGTKGDRTIWGIDSNADIYGQLVAAEIVEFLGGSIASGLANLAQVNLNAAIAIMASGIGQLAPGTEAAALVFLRNVGIEKFFGFVQYAASGGISPSPNVMVLGDADAGTPVGIFSNGARIKVGNITYEVRRLDPFELSGLVTWTVGVPNINWIGQWTEVSSAITFDPRLGGGTGLPGLGSLPTTSTGPGKIAGGQAASPAPKINKGVVIGISAFLLLFLVLPKRKKE